MKKTVIALTAFLASYINAAAQLDSLMYHPMDTLVLDTAVKVEVMPKTKLTARGMQTNVRGSVLENAGTANDVLEKTPGMVKGRNGMEVIGKGTPLYYINGRRVTDLTELDRLQSNEIQNIEVISSPGAQYDATVRSVVRIRTIMRNGEGFGFNLALKDEQSLRPQPVTSPRADMMPDNDPSLNYDMNYRKNSVDVFAGVNTFKFTSRQESDIYGETVGEPGYISDGWLTGRFLQKTVSANTGLNWQISPAHSLGFKLNWGTNWASDGHQMLYDRMTRNGDPYDETMTVGDYANGSYAPYTVSGNAYYSGVAGKLGIDFNLDYYKVADSRRSSTVEDSSMTEDARISTSNESSNDLYAGKLVFGYPVWMGKLEFGSEGTLSLRSDSYTIDAMGLAPSDSRVKEGNAAAFASYVFALPGFGQMSAGLRYEHVDYSYSDALNAADDFSRSYDNLFPSVSWANAFGNVQVMASYSAKTLRPDFSMLSSAYRYNSRYILQRGNSALQPQTINDLSALVHWKWLTAGIQYNRTDSAIASWSTRYNDEGVVEVQPRNLDRPLRLLVPYVNVTPTFGVYNMNWTAGIQQQWLDFDVPDPREASGVRHASFSDRPMLFAQLFNTVSLRSGWQFELGGVVNSRGYSQNLLITNVIFDLSAAIQKAFLPDRSLVLRLEGKDLAGMGHYNVYSDFGGHFIRQTNIMDTQRIILSLRYRFNTAQSKYKGTGAGQDVISRMK